MLTFIPVDSGLTTQAGAGIANGTYAIPQSKGQVPGRYRMSISSGDGVTPAEPSSQPPGPSGNFSSRERIPRRFNVANTDEMVVTREGPNRFDFDIP
jgi:hypothetical protein